MSQNRNIRIKGMISIVLGVGIACKEPEGTFRDMICNTFSPNYNTIQTFLMIR